MVEQSTGRDYGKMRRIPVDPRWVERIQARNSLSMVLLSTTSQSLLTFQLISKILRLSR